MPEHCISQNCLSTSIVVISGESQVALQLPSKYKNSASSQGYWQEGSPSELVEETRGKSQEAMQEPFQYWNSLVEHV